LSLLPDPVPDSRRNRGGVTVPFPEKLHKMLEYAEKNGLTEIVSFFPHGRAFAIHKPVLFTSDIMPKFFKQSRYTSFQRQVNLYGFRRISQGPDTGGYFHQAFLRGRPGLCINMKRTKVKGMTKGRSEPDSEPNFYSMPAIQNSESAINAPKSTDMPSNMSLNTSHSAMHPSNYNNSMSQGAMGMTPKASPRDDTSASASTTDNPFLASLSSTEMMKFNPYAGAYGSMNMTMNNFPESAPNPTAVSLMQMWSANQPSQSQMSMLPQSAQMNTISSPFMSNLSQNKDMNLSTSNDNPKMPSPQTQPLQQMLNHSQHSHGISMPSNDNSGQASFANQALTNTSHNNSMAMAAMSHSGAPNFRGQLIPNFDQQDDATRRNPMMNQYSSQSAMQQNLPHHFHGMSSTSIHGMDNQISGQQSMSNLSQNMGMTSPQNQVPNAYLGQQSMSNFPNNPTIGNSNPQELSTQPSSGGEMPTTASPDKSYGMSSANSLVPNAYLPTSQYNLPQSSMQNMASNSEQMYGVNNNNRSLQLQQGRQESMEQQQASNIISEYMAARNIGSTTNNQSKDSVSPDLGTNDFFTNPFENDILGSNKDNIGIKIEEQKDGSDDVADACDITRV
jgi:hypothetical protein